MELTRPHGEDELSLLCGVEYVVEALHERLEVVPLLIIVQPFLEDGQLLRGQLPRGYLQYAGFPLESGVIRRGAGVWGGPSHRHLAALHPFQAVTPPMEVYGIATP